jgi:diguanylate cyclase (GGDEF)-like protein
MALVEDRAKILIVDDEKINIDVLVGLLKPYYRTVAAKNGEQAFKRLAVPPLPDLILLDVMMPDMDGYEVCRRLKSNPEFRDIPVIFVTAKSDERDEAMGFKVGAVDYITKPLRPLIVLARVKAHIELKRRGDMLEKLVGLDGLTGIANRRQFDTVLASEWKRSIRYHRDIAIILMDIDFFKRYNDYYGHTEGDECLKKIAASISKAMPRAEDLAARYGGEEFACILPETNCKGALGVAHRILEKVHSLNIPHENSSVADHVTISIGVACSCPNLNDTSLELLEMADKALYQAKQGGRNQIVNFKIDGMDE